MPTARRKPQADLARRAGEVLEIARSNGLLDGPRTEMVRGRMPKKLVAAAKRRTGIRSETKLIETALANLAVAEDYMSWLWTLRGTIPRDIDLPI